MTCLTALRHHGRLCHHRRKSSAIANPRSGFSLLEIILALAIFVGSVAVLSRLVVLGMDMTDFATNNASGLVVIESRWGELQGGLVPLQNGTQPSYEVPGWESTMTSQATSMPYVYQVTISAQKAGAPTSKVSLTRLWYDQYTADEASASSQETSSGM